MKELTSVLVIGGLDFVSLDGIGPLVSIECGIGCDPLGLGDLRGRGVQGRNANVITRWARPAGFNAPLLL